MSTLQQAWVPRTSLGKLVQEGKITSMSEIFSQGYKIREAGIVNTLLPNIQQEVLNINLVQKQTDAGEKSRFKAIVVVGNYDGYFGLGMGKAKQVRSAIEKGTIDAKLNVFPVRRGCGSWECGCGQPHSVPFKVVGKCGSVSVELKPAPKGVGIVASEVPRMVIGFTGIRDCWIQSRGSTRTALSFAQATANALKNTYQIVTAEDWTG
ncbi:30S ribosomal protein S5 [Candidatus Bathyarchaeota archaeon]|jgi:small subunit ribosomal protein S5|nr:30S ribosomal protein S5 [Candidatus Bathyarchaeota archaeon]